MINLDRQTNMSWLQRNLKQTKLLLKAEVVKRKSDVLGIAVLGIDNSWSYIFAMFILLFI